MNVNPNPSYFCLEYLQKKNAFFFALKKRRKKIGKRKEKGKFGL
jgi:hypothetical protein